MAAAWHAWRIARRGDIIVAKTDPPLLSVPMAIIAKLRGAHLVNWLQDIFPEVAEALNVGGGVGQRRKCVLRPLRNWSLRSAEVNVVVGQGMADVCRGSGSRRRRSKSSTTGRMAPDHSPPQETRCAKNGSPETASWWATPAISAARTNRHNALGDDLASAAREEVARRSRGQSHVCVHWWRAKRARLESEALKRGLSNFRLRPYQPKERLGETLGVGMSTWSASIPNWRA